MLNNIYFNFYYCKVFFYFLFSADDEFQDLCFEFGLELDEVVSIRYYYDLHIMKSLIISLKTPDMKSYISVKVWIPNVGCFISAI